MKTRPLSFTLNGRAVGPLDVPEGLTLLDVLHEYLNLTGTRFGCGIGVCRACVVIVDQGDGTSATLQTCITPAHALAGQRVRTVEGHARRDARGEVVALSAVQQAFLDHYSFQCGYCTPGFVNAATVLIEKLARAPLPRAQVEAAVLAALDPQLCRCTGYVRYHEAVRDLILRTPGLTREEDAPAS
jgi:aerobic-type carbon monoxide dehydrogenase small subunit (CoxS/CutS family)